MSPIIGSLADASAKGFGFFSIGGSYYISTFTDGNAAASQSSQINAVITDSAKNVYVTANYKPTAGGGNGIIAKIDPSGAILWQRNLADTNASGSQSYYAGGITLDSSNNVYAVGTFNNTSAGRNSEIVKYNSSGTIQWQRKLVGATTAANQQDWVYSCFTDSSANLYVAGYSRNSSNAPQGAFEKYDTNGTIQWQRTFYGGATAGNRNDQWAAISGDSSGNSYLAGTARNASNQNIAYLVKYNSGGAIQWQRSITDPYASGHFGYANGSVIDSSSNVYTGGQGYNSSGGYEAWIAKYNSSGVIQWQRAIDNGGSAAATYAQVYSIGIDSSANIYVGGGYKNSSAGYPGCVLKYNSSGTIQWQRSIADGNTAVNQSETIAGITTDVSGDLYITGQIKNTSGGYNGILMKVPADGSKTGTYTVGTGQTIVYSASSLVDSAGVETDAAGTATDAIGAVTDSAGVMVDSANTTTYTKAGI